MRLEGKPVALQIRKELTERLNLREETVKLAIFRVGENPEDLSYEARVLKNCEILGITGVVHAFPVTVNQEEFLSVLEQQNRDQAVGGILVFRPLPPQLSTEKIGGAVDALKDVDCMNPNNLKSLFLGDTNGILPCTPQAVMELLHYYKISCKGKHVVIVNRSLVLGKPLALLLLAEDATVSLCHSKTKNLKEMTLQGDIVVTGVGKPRFFDSSYFKKDGVVIDVGINFDEKGMCGDVDYNETEQKVAAITPVPGGIGAVTSMVLLNHIM